MKRVLNTRLLFASAVVAGAVGILGYAWHRHESSKLSDTFLHRAAALEQEEKWADAANYLGRHLRLHPEDSQVRIRLIAAVEKSAVSRAGHVRLVSLLYQTLGILPKRNDLRLKLAQELLDLQDFAGAKTQAEALLKTADNQTQSKGLRIIALSLSAQARPGGLISYGEAAKALEKSLVGNPSDVEVAALTAGFYRDHPEEIGSTATAANADAIMDQLVAANPKNAAALIARYRYRQRYGLSNARADLDAVLAREPEHLEALQLESDAILASGDKDHLVKARENCRKIIKLRPTQPSGYLALARLDLADNNIERATDTLLEAHSKLAATNLDVDFLLANLLMDARKIDEAKRIVAEYSAEADRWIPGLPTASRLRVENLNRLLRARLAVSEGEFAQATRDLSAVVASMDKADSSPELLQANLLLATILSQQHRPDLAVAHWLAVAGRAPGLHEAGWKAGAACLELGQADRAIELLDTYLKLPGASPEAWVTMVQAQFQAQTQLPPAERNWKSFLDAVAQAKLKLPNRWEWQFAEAYYLAMQAAANGPKKIAQMFHGMEQKFPKDAALCERLVVAYQQLNSPGDAARLLDRYDEIQPSIARRSILRALYLASNKQIPEALQLLSDAAAKAPKNDRNELAFARLRLLMLARQWKTAQELVAGMIDASPSNAALITAGLEIALERRDFKTAEKWEQLLQRAPTIDDFDYRYFRARRLIGQYDKLDAAQRAEGAQMVETLRSERPSWLPILALGGQLAEVQGNTDGAIEAYQAAIAAGERRTETLERLVRLLYVSGRFDEASRYLARVKADESTPGQMDSLAIVAAVGGNRLDEARDLAQRAVDRGSADPLHFVWLANLEQAGGNQPLAEQTYRTALSKFPQDQRVWNGLFSHFVQTGQKDRARQALQRWVEKVPMTATAKQLVLGQGNAVLGDNAAALASFRDAVAMDPENAMAHLMLAKSLLSSDTAAARPELLEVLRIEPSNAEARQLLAVVLAATGDSSDWAKADQLLMQDEQSKSADKTGADVRLRALLLARKGKNRQERVDNFAAARQLLSNRLEQSSDTKSGEIDRMLLAGIYEQEANLRDDLLLVQAAREVFRPLVDRKNPSPEHLISYIQLLMRHIKSEASGKADTESDRELRRALTDDAGLRIDDLEKLRRDDQGLENAILPLALRMKLFDLQGRQGEGLKLVKQWTEEQLAQTKNDSERAKVYLQTGNLYRAAGAFAEAESSYRQLQKLAPNSFVLVAQSLVRQNKADEAIKLCLQFAANKPSSEVATLLAQILSTENVSAGVAQKARPVIEAALDADRGNVDLLISYAIERVTHNDNEEAIRLFRRVVELRPNHALALNNLATLLAEYPDRLGDAQQYVERAIRIAGRSPALLDTLGTILVRSQQYEQAVASLEEAVAGTDDDPRYYFHLAAAYEGTGRQTAAQQALQRAMQLGLDKAILTSGDRELLASLKHELLTLNLRD